MSNSTRIVQMERSKYIRSRSLPRPRAYAFRNPTKNKRSEFYGISKRKEQFANIRKVGKYEI